ncbi:50S ribosomal protein L25/general stress protein Ctc [Pseudonocardia sp. HH130630-07]|uniref:50S ribosomal protein L25/general stress protein Ctc n=1 Tax=Pseudonocardia sp. HH130630-07 TaxID=1690815 RepID=UPI0008151A0E|nr:50S ribosomal protein L25/general stress protein Ctc [Pseudonocardia sp. HH130630-07]ANY06095.1 50S ribosomal protein L25/general stress protein Ctc [Pseudonocardia sp. HH130630-07]
MAQTRIPAETRTEFGKGAARRTRRAGKIPAVLYGHGTDPVHLSLPSLEFAAVVREQGRNAVLELDVAGSAPQLALTKTVVVHPLRPYVEHVDLLVIKRGEKVEVELNVVVSGDAAPGSLVTQDMNTVLVEADALNIPESIEVSVEDAAIGTQVYAKDLKLPGGVELRTDEEYLVVQVVPAPTEEDLEAEVDTEGAGVVEDPSDEEQAEASEESAEGASDEAAEGDSEK